MFPGMPIKLHDCIDRRHDQSDKKSELLIVEGDSASKSAAHARDASFQAVLPMQGKPLNAWKASQNAVERNELFSAVTTAIGVGLGYDLNIDEMRYDQITLVFDPDADGIHCGALMLMFFYRWMRPLVDQGLIGQIQPPIYEIRSPDGEERLHAFSDQQYRRIRAALEAKQMQFQSQRYRGLASMNSDTLVRTCLDPSTRHRILLTQKDAEAAIGVFGGGQPRRSLR